MARTPLIRKGTGEKLPLPARASAFTFHGFLNKPKIEKNHGGHGVSRRKELRDCFSTLFLCVPPRPQWLKFLNFLSKS
jgi:hypothetical protein